MISKCRCIYNANIVLKNKVIFGSIVIKNGRIDAILEGTIDVRCFKNCEMQNASSRYIIPGIIDIRNNSFKNGIDTVTESNNSFHLFFDELEKKLSLSGITSVYHLIPFDDLSLHMEHENKIDLISEIFKRKFRRHMMHHRVHLEYDNSKKDTRNKVIELIQLNHIHFISLVFNSSMQFELLLAENFEHKGRKIKKINFTHLLQHAMANGVGIATQVDEGSYTIPEILYNPTPLCSKKLSEEPAESVFVLKSIKDIDFSNPISYVELKNQQSDTILYSDEFAYTLIPTIFKYAAIINDLAKAVEMVTLAPAKALGIADYFGSIEQGKFADLVMVELYDNVPLVKETFLNGRRVIACDYFE